MIRRPTLVSSADLLRALKLVGGDAVAADRMAGLLGFQRVEVKAEDTIVLRPSAATAGTSVQMVTMTVSPGRNQPLRARLPAITFCERIDPSEPDPPMRGAERRLTATDCQPRRLGMPPAMPLVRPQRLWPAVKRSLAVTRYGRLDVRRLGAQLARAEPVTRLPRLQQSWWNDDLVVVWDRGERMAPYQADYRALIHQIVAARGRAGLRICTVENLPDQVVSVWPAGSSGPPVLPPIRRGSAVLLLSDLGALSESPLAASCWRSFAKSMREMGAKTVAWAPHSPRQLEAATAGLVRVHCLDRFGNLRPQRGRIRNPEQRRAELQRLHALRDRLLTWASFCIRVEPELLREMRNLDRETRAEPGLEGLTWAYRPVVRASAISRPLSPEYQSSYRQRFGSLPPDEQRRALAAALRVHAWQGRSTEMLETLIWDSHADESAKSELERAALHDARSWIDVFRDSLKAGAVNLQEATAFAEDVLSRNWQDQAFQSRHSRWLAELWALTGQRAIPPGLQAAHVTWVKRRQGGTAQTCQLLQVESRLVLWPGHLPERRHASSRLGSPMLLEGFDFDAGPSGGRHWFEIGSGLAMLLELTPDFGESRFIANGHRYSISGMERPPWADSMGRDHFGLFADFTLTTEHGSATQRLRWIEPGTFTMGSPDDELERDSDEGPTHPVTISRGSWLADTACTQALWRAVIGRNPSHFTGDDQRPVERVSWNDVQDFLRKLEALLPGCKADLPTEAEWEYACRAGTDTPFNFGPDAKAEQSNYDTNFPFSLGEKVSLPVKSMPPNAWGLYEMHGSVWEWCADGFRVYRSRPELDPIGLVAEDDRGQRALRGGSSFFGEKWVRSASRRSAQPSVADTDLGFRFCLRSIEPDPGLTRYSDAKGTASGKSSAVAYTEIVDAPIPEAAGQRSKQRLRGKQSGRGDSGAHR